MIRDLEFHFFLGDDNAKNQSDFNFAWQTIRNRDAPELNSPEFIEKFIGDSQDSKTFPRTEEKNRTKVVYSCDDEG